MAEAYRPRETGPDPVRSVRVSEEVWQAVKQRAALDGVTPSYVVRLLLVGYARELYALPKVTVDWSVPEQRTPPVPSPAGSEDHQLAR